MILLAMLLALAPAPTAQAGAQIIGFGMRSCGDWTSSKSDPNREYLFESWLGGYLSGVNVGLGLNLTEGSDFDGFHGWIDSYCAAHPLDQVSTAAVSLTDELVKRKGATRR